MAQNHGWRITAVQCSDYASSEASSGVDSILDEKELYLAVNPKSNLHWGAQDIANSGEFKPRRQDLYGNKSYMVFTKGGSDNGGNLGLAHGYAEALSLYGKTSADMAESLAKRVQLI